LRRGKKIRKTSVRRAGLWQTERVVLKDLYRAVVMLRFEKEMTFTKAGKPTWVGPCEKCVKWRPMFVSHIESVGRVRAMEFDPDNAVPLCSGCHIFWWHKQPREADRWITERIGAAKRDLLELRAKTWSKSVDWGSIRLSLESELRGSEDGRQALDAITRWHQGG
jgi:hypothetical protein